ncbi:sugar phosphate isomerase/epimerase family protein [Gilvimarinus polysaccharolyticus]|uniref:sugar phosphate isomerase/epimerase family protein n=1 Tax=Gilvimarinus polysaccharolyticus TaxID=863921 RepID=UPI0006735294|nr:sugar phosphate isomerase/epimerase [Gilvimarinus polysaccharolyticus]
MSIFKRFLASCLLAVTALSGAVSAAEPELSVQLWSVKDDLSQDFKGTLESLADMGFDAVEFAGNFGPYANDPTGLKAYLAEIGLEASGAHVGFDQLSDDKFYQTVAFYLALGADYLVVPWDERAFSPDGVADVAAQLNDVAGKLAAYGLLFGYHNHAQELAPYKNTTFWDYIATHTDDRVVLQLDAGWATVAGKDAAAYIRKYPGRTIATHIKAGLPEGTTGKQTILGQDVADWAAVITAAREVGGTQWLVVEQEEYPEGMTPLQSVAASVDGLRDIMANM